MGEQHRRPTDARYRQKHSVTSLLRYATLTGQFLQRCALILTKLVLALSCRSSTLPYWRRRESFLTIFLLPKRSTEIRVGQYQTSRSVGCRILRTFSAFPPPSQALRTLTKLQTTTGS